MGKYRKKPVVIEAIQWNGNNLREIERFVIDPNLLVEAIENDDGKHPKLQDYTDVIKADGNKIRLKTLESDGETQVADVGDYIIKGVQGEFYPCKPDIFNQTYEVVED